MILLAVAGCDLSPTVDVDTPAFDERLVLRGVLGAGEPARLRVGVARDPFGVYREDDVPQIPTDAMLTVWRGDRLVETLRFESRTCYRQATSSCDAATGETRTETSGPFECGRYVGDVALESGPHRVRAERSGLPTAEAEVDVPVPPTAAARATGPNGDRLGFQFDLDDAPGEASRYGVSLMREFDRAERRVCAVGGLRDTVLAVTPQTYTTTFGTDDPVLRPAAREVDGEHQLIVFDDAAFRDTRRRFTLDAPPEGTSGLLGTGRFDIQLAALSPTLYDYLRETTFALDAETPFDEPANLPSNVTGGYGHVGAIAITVAPAD